MLITPKVMPKLYRQISYGIDEIIQKCGADIHSTEDWETIFLLLKTARIPKTTLYFHGYSRLLRIYH